jgi:Lipid A 3-O-deacylase (PagL)
VSRTVVVALLALLLGAPALAAQAQSASRAASAPPPAPQAASEFGPRKGSREIEVWTSAGGPIELFGSREHTPVWNLGVRYGWVLTGLRGPSFLRGRFEYGVDAVPVYVFFQPQRTSYGVGVDPFALKWDFQPRRRIVPYFEITGGGILANHAVPRTDTAFNFTLTTALGFSVFRGRHAVNIDFRLFHLSNAGLSNPNLGLNNLQVRIGFSLFHGPK